MRQLSFSAKKIGQNIKNIRPAVVVPSVRLFSSFVEREKAAENIYIRDQEAAKIAAIRAKFEKIIASDDHAHKEEVMQLIAGKIYLISITTNWIYRILLNLETKTQDEGIISKMGLDDWRFALPIGMILAVPALANEVSLYPKIINI